MDGAKLRTGGEVWSGTQPPELDPRSRTDGRFAPCPAAGRAAEGLSELPLRGRSIGGGRRTLVAIPPYLIRYRVTCGTVEIIIAGHGAW